MSLQRMIMAGGVLLLLVSSISPEIDAEFAAWSSGIQKIAGDRVPM